MQVNTEVIKFRILRIIFIYGIYKVNSDLNKENGDDNEYDE